MESYGYFYVACITPTVQIADMEINQKIAQRLLHTLRLDIQLAVFPELSLCVYTCQGLLYQNLLLDDCLAALKVLQDENESEAILVVGPPLRQGNHLSNYAAFLYRYDILGIAPKIYVLNYNELYEKRWFSDSEQRMLDMISLFGESVPFIPNLLIHDETSGAVVIAEVCEDLWVPIPPSTRHARHGVNVVANLSASNETVGKSEYRKAIITAHNVKNMYGHVYTSAGVSESANDLVFSEHDIIAGNGTITSESEILEEEYILYGEIDLEKCRSERLKLHTAMQIQDSCTYTEATIRTTPTMQPLQLTRNISPHPSVPGEEAQRSKRCMQILHMQVAGLAQRLKKINCIQLIIGISGGLDSTLALFVVHMAFERLGLNNKGIPAVIMLGSGTTRRTRGNSHGLMVILYTGVKEISIHDVCEQHFHDIGYDLKQLDIIYESTQARERTQILMDLANTYNGIVLGTGDLSEPALGWCTYNGDYMSMYGVNASIPRTLVRHLVKTYVQEMRKTEKADIVDISDDIYVTPVPSGLLPPKVDDGIVQITEDAIGSYAYHDFFLYHTLRNYYAPVKILKLTVPAFLQEERRAIPDTTRIFCRRFFTQQFKRSAMPDGVKVGFICLSLCGDWRMSSDVSVAAWIRQVNDLRQTPYDQISAVCSDMVFKKMPYHKKVQSNPFTDNLEPSS